MAKTVRERDIRTRAKRAALAPSGKPYWRTIDEGLHCGYRKGLHSGKWVMRHYAGAGLYSVKTLGLADDNQDADNEHILSFPQAQQRAREWAKQYRVGKSGSPDLTVKAAIEAYLSGQRGRDQRGRLANHVLASGLSNRSLASLTEHALAGWLASLPHTLTDATKKRIATDFRAALNAAAKIHRKDLPADFAVVVQHGLAVRSLVVENHREPQVLPDADIRKLIGAAQTIDARDGWGGDLYRMIIALAATGARFSQVQRLTVADVQDGRILVPVSGKGRGTKSVSKIAVQVGPDVTTVLRPAIAGRMGHEILLLRPHWTAGSNRLPIGDREPWKFASQINVPWRRIRSEAGLAKTVIPLALRHSSIVRGLRAALPARLVAALHDTSVAMIEKHYSAYITDALGEVAAKAIVPLTTPPPISIKVAAQ